MANGNPKPAFYLAVFAIGRRAWSGSGCGASARCPGSKEARQSAKKTSNSRWNRLTARGSPRPRTTPTFRRRSFRRCRASPTTSRWPTARCGSR